MAKALFFPNYLGGGFGHTGRCVALADALRRRGGEAAFALGGPHLERVVRTGHKVRPMKTPRMRKRKAPDLAYVYFSGMNYQIVRDGFHHPGQVGRALSEAMKIVRETKPDVLVGDGHPITRLVAHQAGLPLVQLVKSVAHPQPERMVWWEEDPEGIRPPDPGPVFNPVLRRIGLPEIGRAEELLSGDLLVLPSIPILDPMDPFPQQTYYVGPIIRRESGRTQLPTWFSELGEEPVIFVTVGGAAGNAGGGRFYEVVGEAFKGTGCQVVVSTGGKGDPKVAAELPSNIRLVSWVPGAEMIARSQLVLFHGGYTRMEILARGLPSIVTPFHSEQEYYGRLMEEAGVAELVHVSEEPYRHMTDRWRGGGWRKAKPFTWHARFGLTLQPGTLRAAVERVLSDETMRSRAQELGKELESRGGCKRVLDLVEDKIL